MNQVFTEQCTLGIFENQSFPILTSVSIKYKCTQYSKKALAENLIIKGRFFFYLCMNDNYKLIILRSYLIE